MEHKFSSNTKSGYYNNLYVENLEVTNSTTINEIVTQNILLEKTPYTTSLKPSPTLNNNNTVYMPGSTGYVSNIEYTPYLWNGYITPSYTYYNTPWFSIPINNFPFRYLKIVCSCVDTQSYNITVQIYKLDLGQPSNILVASSNTVTVGGVLPKTKRYIFDFGSQTLDNTSAYCFKFNSNVASIYGSEPYFWSGFIDSVL